jgi:hypothetical protein
MMKKLKAILKGAMYVGLGFFLFWVIGTFWSVDLNSYAHHVGIKAEANDIGQAFVAYKKDHAGTNLNVNSPDWADKLRDYLDDKYKTRIVSSNELDDPFGYSFELSQEGNVIKIYSLNMNPVVQVDLNTEKISYTQCTTWQAFKHIIRFRD